MLFTTAALSALALPLAVLAAPLESRSDDARFTFYNTETGLGACGNWNPGWKNTVALNTKDFNSLGGGYPAASCGKWVWIAHPDSGEKIWAEVQDECPTCPDGGVDLSEGLFTKLMNKDAGVFQGSWGWSSK